MKVTLVISELEAGGAQRQLSLMANEWVVKGWQIRLLTFDHGITPPFYPLDKRIEHCPLGIAGNSSNVFAAMANNIRRLLVLRKAIRKKRPDLVLSFLDRVNILLLLATAGLDLPVVVSERTVPSAYPLGFAWESLRNLTYPTANAIVVQTETVKRHFSNRLQTKTFVIPNQAVFPSPTGSNEQIGLKRPAVIAIGRLGNEKGFDLLMEAFGKTKHVRNQWHLYIFGEGPERDSLEKQRGKLGLNDTVHLPGTAKDIFRVYRSADLFVLSSRFEGFPNVLCEAMSCGLPVISFDCPGAPGEIIRPGLDGVLVPNGNADELANAMTLLMSDEKERARLGASALEITKRLSPERVMGMWEELFGQILKKKST